MSLAAVNNWSQQFKRDPENAWSVFIDQYHPLISRIISGTIKSYDDRMEAYSFILEKLKTQKHKKIVSYYECDRSYDFSVWISVIVRNSCRDWFRAKNGRVRPPLFIKESDEIDRLLYKYIFSKNYPDEIVYDLMISNHNYSESFSRMLQRLSDIRKHLKNRKGNVKYQKTDKDPADISDPETAENAEQIIIIRESVSTFKACFENLDHIDQLILKLHFLHCLTLKEISKIIKMNSIWRVHRRLKKAICKLSTDLRSKGIGSGDLDITFLDNIFED